MTSSNNGSLTTGTARLTDIAAHAGVSEATVSRVLNGKPG
ncbi:LacI family DNA-binding transcriptional regulator, partial [Planobispora takensis]